MNKDYSYGYACNVQYIEENANNLFSKLKQEAYLSTATAEDMPLRLAYYLSEINVLHPFREGNGRTQRLFIEFLAEKNDFVVDFSAVTDKEMVEASALAFGCDYEKMNVLMAKITSSISPQQEQIQTIL